MKNPFQASVRNVRKFATTHKFWSTVIVLALVGVGYYSFKHGTTASASTRYVLGTVSRGTLVTSVTGTGQVSALDQIDVKPQVSGNVVWVGVTAGQNVVAGQPLLELDDTTERQSLATAELDLAAAKLSYVQSAAQAPVDYQRQTDAVSQAQTGLTNEYDNAFNTVSAVYLDLPTNMTGIQNVLYGTDLSKQLQANLNYYENLFSDPNNPNNPIIMGLATGAVNDYQTALAAYNTSFADFQNLTRTSSPAAIENVLNETLSTAKAIAQAAKSEKNLVDTVVTTLTNLNRPVNPTITGTYVPDLISYIGSVNGNLATLNAEVTALQTAKTGVTTAQQNLAVLQTNNSAGDNPISLQVASNTIAQKEQNIENMKQTLAEYVVRAPFDGVIAKVNVQNGDPASSGTAVATVVTSKENAVVTLNEVDVSKVKVGDKATLTFDALSGLSLTGTVSEVDTIGTVSQGVVTYSVTITFDTQDPRVKPGMSVTAAIISSVTNNVLVVPNSAIKTLGGQSFVQVLTGPTAPATGGTGVTSSVPPELVPVTTGVSNDTETAIESGVSDGQTIVFQTVNGTASAGASAAAGGLRVPGLPGGGGGGGTIFRAGGGRIGG